MSRVSFETQLIENTCEQSAKPVISTRVEARVKKNKNGIRT